MRRPSVPTVLWVVLVAWPAVARADSGATARLDRAVAAAEAGLKRGDLRAAEGRYAEALGEGWLLLGTLARLEGRLPAAREAFLAAGDHRGARLALALAHLQGGHPAEAVTVLEALAASEGADARTRLLLGQALLAAGQDERGLRTLEEVRAAHPSDLQAAFALASAWLARDAPERAAPLFEQVRAARPIPQTRVLIGRAWRDAGERGRARAEFRAALGQDPRARHAHYNLGMLALEEKGMAGVAEALPHFEAELRLDPDDPVANLELGIALVESQRPAEAVAALEKAARALPPSPRVLYYLGRALVGAERPREAAPVLEEALARAGQEGASAHALRGLHLQLGQALRALGRAEEAGVHFAAAARLSEREAGEARDELARRMSEAGPSPAAAPLPLLEASPLAELSPEARAGLRQRVTATLARAYLNLGVLRVQAGRFEEAAERFEKAAALDPDFPQVQSSLGVARFNARQFDKATGPLERALRAQPSDRGLGRMLAMAWLNLGAFDKTAALLRDDPEREADPSLQFAYGLSLVRSDRAAEAEQVFSRMLARHGDTAEVNVLLGQAHAQQGDYEAAVAALLKALRLQADVAEAHGALGVIYLRQGRMAEAEAALRAELKVRPDDVPARQNLAIVLEAEQRPDEALALLRPLVRSRPELADPRYLLGKILVAEGAPGEALPHLQEAARLAPGDANIQYQLGRALQRLGRGEEAEAAFARYRELKAAR